MPAPRHPNTTAATAVVRRRGQETMAAKLRVAGWVVIPPEHAKSVPPDLAEILNRLAEADNPTT